MWRSERFLSLLLGVSGIAVGVTGYSLVFCGAVHAAPCCSSRTAAPAIISGDDQARLALSTSQATVIGDAPDEGIAVFRSGNVSEVTQLLRLDGSMILTDRFQLGLGVPLIRRQVRSATSKAEATRLGDLSLSSAYEALPEWTYSTWKPKGFVFAQLTLPTGRSLYESTATNAVDATGRGFFSVSSGGLFTKSWERWDAFLLPELHYSFTRTFESVTVAPGFGASIAVGGGFSPESGSSRYGIRIQPAFDQGKQVRADGGESRSGAQKSWTVSLDWSYLLSADWSFQVSYADQTLLGPARNSTLSRTFLLGVQRSWQR